MSLELRFDPAAVLLHSTLILAFGLLASAVLRKRGPAVRVATLRATLVGLVAIVAFGVVGIERAVAPAVRVAVPAQVELPASAVRRVSPALAASPFPAPVSSPEPAVSVDWRPWAAGAWVAGGILLSLRSLVGHFSLVRLRRRGRPASPRIVEALRLIAGDGAPALSVADVASPFIAGVLRSTLYLHPDAEKADDDTLKAILSHEIVHYRQRDCAWRALSTIACALLWPQPLAWLLARRLEAATEDACDAAVVRGGASRAAYASCLLSLAERKPLRTAERAFGASVIPNRSHVGRRVAAILNEKTANLGPASLSARFALGGLMLVVAAGATVLVATRTPQGTYTPDSDPKAIAAYERMLAAIGGARSLSFTVESGPPGAMKTSYTVAYQAPARARVVEMQQDSLVPAVSRYLDGERIVIESAQGKSYSEIRRLSEPETRNRREWGPSDWPASNPALRQLQMNGVQNEVLGQLAVTQTPLPQLYAPVRRVVFDVQKRLSVETLPPVEVRDRQKNRTLYTLGPDALPRLVRKEINFNGGGEYVTESRYLSVRLNPRLTDKELAFRPRAGAIAVLDEARRGPTPEAKAILNEMRAAYDNLRSLRFEAKGAGGTMTAQLVRPNRARIEVRYDQYYRQNLTLVADGRRMLVENAMYPDRVLLTAATPDGIANLGGTGVAMNLSEVMQYLRMAMTDSAPRIDSQPFRVIGQSEANGAACDVIETKWPFSDQAGFPQQGTYHLQRLFIGRGDHLVRRLETESKFAADKPEVRKERLDFRNLVANGPVDEESFRIVPPEGKKTFDSASAIRETSPMVRDEDKRPGIGGPAPEIVTTTLDGKPFDLKSLRGKTVILHAWTYGVSNQREDLPKYEAMQRKYGPQGLVVVGVPCENPDQKGRLIADLKAWKILTTQLWDGKGNAGGVQRGLGLSRFPYSRLILPDGRIFARDFFGERIEPTVQAALNR